MIDRAAFRGLTGLGAGIAALCTLIVASDTARADELSDFYRSEEHTSELQSH